MGIDVLDLYCPPPWGCVSSIAGSKRGFAWCVLGTRGPGGGTGLRYYGVGFGQGGVGPVGVTARLGPVGTAAVAGMLISALVIFVVNILFACFLPALTESGRSYAARIFWIFYNEIIKVPVANAPLEN